MPKDIDANLAYRADILRLCASDDKARQDIWIACSRDCLYYVNVFGWTLDPRKTRTSPVLPFITWECQDEAYAKLDDAIRDGKDVGCEKSRDMGMSWIICTLFEWHWHFHDNLSFLLGSRNEDYVDMAGNNKALFQKIDFFIEHLPRWLIPTYSRTKLRLTNEENGSCIDGESTTGDFGRGDRRTAIALDEFAAVEIKDGYKVMSSTRDTTNCRIFNSTYQGTGNAFFDAMQTVEVKVSLPWWRHPEKSAGLYRDANGKRRSPWYDDQCKRAVHPVEIIQELDMDPIGSGYQFYETEPLNHHVRTHALEPFMVGDLSFTEHDCTPTGFHPTSKGMLKLWLYVDSTGKPPADRQYAIGADISNGTGASNSCLSVGDKRTGEQVAILTTPHMRPDQLGKVAVALARWFNNAVIVPEANGPGRIFIAVIVDDCGYTNMWWRTNNELSLSRKASMVPGWYATKETKLALHGEFRRALGTERMAAECIIRDKATLEECRQLVFSPTGGVTHSGAVSSIDPSGAKENHADRPTGAALMWKGMKESVRMPANPQALESSNNTLAARRVVAHKREIQRAQW